VGVKRPAVLPLLAVLVLAAQTQTIEWTAQEKPISDQIRALRQMPDDVRARTTRQLALDIRALSSPNKMRLAMGLASRATEGDFGRETLQEVANTLVVCIREQPPKPSGSEPAAPYATLAELAQYEGVSASLDDPQYPVAMDRLRDNDRARASADFTLTDLHGTQWHLKGLRGNVMLVNFWATWCQPCRKEMPDLEALQRQFAGRLVVLGISDEERAKIEPFIANAGYTFPILLDAGRRVGEQFRVEGIPKTFIYDAYGRLAAQAMDMRTRGQFAEHAGPRRIDLDRASDNRMCRLMPSSAGPVSTARANSSGPVVLQPGCSRDSGVRSRR
jgi:peroxiredoxin